MDWIQTRYLFVQVLYTGPQTVEVQPPAVVGEGKIPDQIYKQDPNMMPRNSLKEALIIPANAISHVAKKVVVVVVAEKDKSSSSILRGKISSSLKKSLKPRKKQTVKVVEGVESDVSVNTDNEDLMILVSDDEEEDLKHKHPDGHGINALAKTANRISKAAMKMLSSQQLTDFVPGSLDMTGIQILPPPSYASTTATRRLQAELKAIPEPRPLTCVS